MNESILQLLPLVDTGLAPRQVERTGQPRRAIPAVAETHRSHGRDDTSRAQENSAQDADNLPEMVEELNTKLQEMQRGLRFSVDDSSGRIVVKVIDLDTDEVIRQIPSEEMLSIIRNVSSSENFIFSDEA